MKKLKGVIPPMLTPFTAEGDLDIPGLEKLVTFLKDKVDGIFVTGSYGGGPMMSMEERKKVVEVCTRVAEGQLQIVTMIGTTNTRDAVELAKHSESCGVDAVAAVGPFYYTHNEDDLISFYTDIIDAVDIPVYLYNNTKFQGYEIGLETIRKLKDKGLAGIKDATFDILTHANYHRVLKDDNFDIALGTEAMWASARIIGCEAFIPGLANAFPEIVTKMYKQGMEGDYEGMMETQFQVNKLRDIMYLAKSTQLAIYAMLEIRGVLTCYPRKPFVAASEEEKAAMRAELEKLGMLQTV